MVDNFMPDVVVEIAFDSGYTTADADRTWTDVSAYVDLERLIGISVGRQDERSTADANRLTLTLDNTDGRFTAGRSSSPYYPNVKVGRPIRVTATPVGGDEVTRFVGFIDEWPVEWEATDAYAAVPISASSRLARLGLGARLGSMIESEILSAGPRRYWTLGDPANSTTAANSAGDPQGALEVLDVDGGGAAIVFGNATGPGTDGLTAAEFAGVSGATPRGQYLFAELALPSGPRTLRAAILVGALPASDEDPVQTGVMRIRLTSAGLIAGNSTTGPSINDGETHDVVVVRDGTNEILYVDGVEVDTAAAAAPGAMSGIQVGNDFTGTMSHVAVYDVALTAAQVAAQAEVVASGADGDTTDERLLRILGWAGVADTEVDAETGAETMTYQQTSGQSIVEALRDVESTENGVLFDGTDGRVVFHNRSRRYLAEVAVTLDMEAQHVGADYAPKLDRSTLANDVEVENPTTEETARARDTDSSDEYGVATRSVTVIADTSDALAQRASWEVAAYAEPRSRVPSLTVDVLAHVGLTPSAEDLLGLGVGDLIELTNTPTQADATTATYFIEGYSERIGPESWEITFNLSPTHPSLSTFVIGDATRGELDSSFVLAH